MWLAGPPEWTAAVLVFCVCAVWTVFAQCVYRCVQCLEYVYRCVECVYSVCGVCTGVYRCIQVHTVCVQVCTGAHRVQKRISDPLELLSQVL